MGRLSTTECTYLPAYLAVTNSYSTVPVLLWDCTGQPNP